MLKSTYKFMLENYFKSIKHPSIFFMTFIGIACTQFYKTLIYKLKVLFLLQIKIPNQLVKQLF